ncbi:unnamed protein product [Moneuplotes crassus]|uniref:Uncharacterized protein n=1 Tax=Euplotes crassus TaxID=5936 RepID=A0AAD1UIR7_EUPCR|nr:unnamed protein product [Moneuplotes crassus]
MAKGKKAKNKKRSAQAGQKRTRHQMEETKEIPTQQKQYKVSEFEDSNGRPKPHSDFLNDVNSSGGDLAMGLIMTSAAAHDEITVWDPKTRAQLHTFRELKFKPASNTLCVTNECGGVVLCASSTKTQLVVWDFNSSTKLFAISTKEPITCLKIMNKGAHIIAGTKGGRINIWNSQSGKLIADSSAHFEEITHMSLDANDTLLLTGSSEGNAKLWSIGDLIVTSENRIKDDQENVLETEAECIAEFKGHANRITGVLINKFATRAYTCSEDKTCKIWDLFSGAEIKTITCISPIKCMEVDKIETSIYLGCKNKNVYCFSIEAVLNDWGSQKSARVLNPHKNEISTMSLTKNERYLVVGSTDGVIYIWDLYQDDHLKTLERHKDCGEITNILPLTKPISLFGLSSVKTSPKLPFLMVNETENQKLDKALSPEDSSVYAEFMCRDDNTDMANAFQTCTDMLSKSEEQLEEEYWSML